MNTEELKEILAATGRSNYAIEKELKLSNGTIGKILNGSKNLTEGLIESFASLTIPDPVIEKPEEPSIIDEVLKKGEKQHPKPDKSLIDLLG